jgi:hypothetical protein
VVQKIREKRETREEQYYHKLLRQENAILQELKGPKLNGNKGELQYKLDETRKELYDMDHVALRIAAKNTERERKEIIECLLNEG